MIIGIIGIITIDPVGILGIIFGLIDIVMYSKCKNIIRLIDKQEYKKAKSSTLIWMIIGLIFGGILPGILMLIAYIKLGELPSTPMPTPA